MRSSATQRCSGNDSSCATSAALSHRDGCASLAFEIHGEGPCCVFIHGFGEGRYVWMETIRRWHGQAIAIDLQGHGDSDWSADGGYSIAHDADMVLELLGRICDLPFVLVGHSRGAAVSARVAAAKPVNLAGLILVDHDPNPTPICLGAVSAEFEQLNREFADVEAFANWLSERRPVAAADTIKRLAPLAVRNGPSGGVVAKRDPAMILAKQTAKPEPPLLETLAAIDLPVMIVRGQISAFLLANTAQNLAAAAPLGCIATVPIAGHSLMIDNPSGFVEAIASFVMNTIDRSASRLNKPDREGF